MRRCENPPPKEEDCPNCEGDGKVTSGTGQRVDCPFCHGTGKKK